MSTELVKALVKIIQTCANATSCEQCAFRDFCGKIPSEW